MAFELKRTIDRVFDDGAVGQLGAILHENERNTRRGLKSAVAAVWRSVMASASTEDGVRMIENELDRQDGSILKDFPKHLSFDNHRRLAERGNDMLQAFTGNQTQGVIGAVSRASGMGVSSTRSLLGMVTPVVASAVGEHRRDKELTTKGLRELFRDGYDAFGEDAPRGLDEALDFETQNARGFFPDQMRAYDDRLVLNHCEQRLPRNVLITPELLTEQLKVSPDRADDLLVELQRREAIDPRTGFFVGRDDDDYDEADLLNRCEQELGDKRISPEILSAKLGVPPAHGERLFNTLCRRDQVNPRTGAYSTTAIEFGPEDEATSLHGAAGYTGSGTSETTANGQATGGVAVADSGDDAETKKGGMGWLALLPLLLLLGLLCGLGWWLANRENTTADDGAAVAAADDQTQAEGTDVNGSDANDAVSTTGEDPATTAATAGTGDSEHGTGDSDDSEGGTVGAVTADATTGDADEAKVGESQDGKTVGVSDGGADQLAEEGSGGTVVANTEGHKGGDTTKVAEDAEADVTAAATGAALGEAAPLTFAVANERLPALLKSATKSLGEVRDLESARKVVPMLNKATESINDFGKHAADWTADARQSLGEHVTAATPGLQAAVAKILTNKEVRKEVESPVTKLLAAVTKLLPAEAASK